MGEEAADDQTPFFHTQPAEHRLQRTGLVSVHPLINPSLVRLFYFQLMVTIIIIKCFERTKIQGS